MRASKTLRRRVGLRTFNFSPGTDTPADILKIRVEDGGKYFDLTPEDIKAAQGYVTFREAGEQTVTFQYKGGAHRLQLVGVDVIKAQTDEVVAHDYHFGYTGGKTENNVFTLNIPEKGTYLIRYFVETLRKRLKATVASRLANLSVRRWWCTT